ncbi:SRPBCC domain-containing protein [Gemmobacter sp.]|uniref:SRPBCC domain-containing protein n=1 Tax=Gemmobacter sp. TaxID=1898957 RepID=UPI002AFDE3E5|nr:SRPBCC domain-containing protein [Gemmobacter sp.]
MQPNPDTDLELVCQLKAPPHKVWRCLTEAALIERWFAPRPVVTRDVTMDPVPGGSFITTMDIPDHGSMTGHGCVLLADAPHRIVWTDLLQGGYRPAGDCFGFTAHILLEPDGTGTRYRAIAQHVSAQKRAEHAAMGFHDGWGKAAEQLDEVALSL